MRDDVLKLFRCVTQVAQRFAHRPVDDLQHAAAGEQLVFDQRNVRFDASGIAVHQEGDGPRGGQHGHLRVAVSVLFSQFKRLIPAVLGGLPYVIEFLGGADVLHRRAVQFDDAEHGPHVVLGQRFRHVHAARVFVAFERAELLGHARRLLVGFAGHDGGDGPGQGAGIVRVIGQPVAHDERAEVGVTQAEGAEDVRVLGDFPDRIARVVHQDFLRRDEEAHRGLETVHIEGPVLAFEFHQVQGREVAGGVVEKHVLGAGVGGMDRLRALACVPFLNRAVVLQSGIAAVPRAFRDLQEQFGGVFLFQRLARGDGPGPPLPAGDRGLHEFVAHAHGQVLILEPDAPISLPVERPVVALIDQGPGFFLFQVFGVDELLDVPVPVTQGIHLGRAAGLAARLHNGGDPVVNLQEREGTARTAAAGELLAA